MSSSRGMFNRHWRGTPLVHGVLGISVVLLSGLPALAAEKVDSSRSRERDRQTTILTDPGNVYQQAESENRFEALLGTARFTGIKTETEVTSEEKVITYKEPETVFKTAFEDQSGWQLCRCRTVFGWRERCVWCSRVVEKQAPQVVEVDRQRVERVPHEITRQVPAKAVEPVVVHSRRPYVKKPGFTWDEPQSVAEQGSPAISGSAPTEVSLGFESLETR